MLSKFKRQLSDSGEVYLRVKIRPNANQNKIKEILQKDGSEIIKIDIKSPSVKSWANKELIYFLAGEFGVLAKNIKITSGTASSLKLIKINSK